jgi:hypothetical protein
MEFGDLRESPFMLGISPFAGFGLCDDWIVIPLEVRFGRVFSNNWYVMGELAMSYFYSYPYIEPSIRVGYNFGNKKNLRK